MKSALTIKYLLCILITAICFSCEKDNSQTKLLKEAQDSLDNGKPDVALNILTSIQNPENMDKDSYMQYLVAIVGAKYETKADITKDTLILEAQRYFNAKGNHQKAALANYYTAQLYDESGNFPKALETYMLTVYESEKSQNNLLAAKSFNNIGYIYFEQVLLDSAITNYKKALLSYNKIENVESKKLRTLSNLGRSYEFANRLDSAYSYFHQGLILAKETNNKPHESTLSKNLGVVCYGMKDYNKAIEYFQTALAMNETEESDLFQIHLYLLNIYNKKQDLKLATQYADLVIADLPKVGYIYTVKEMYAALADYYTLTSNYKQALEYRDLEKATKEQIEQETNAPALLDADKNFSLAQKERQAQEFMSQVVFFLILGAIAFGIILVFVVFVWKDHKKNQAEIRACAEKYDILKGMLLSMSEKDAQIEDEIKSMLEED